jgi:Protein of unknwon function (DUF3310)
MSQDGRPDKFNPAYYKGNNGMQPIDVVEAFELGYSLANAVKYILRAGKKPGESELDDLMKAQWYIERRLMQVKIDKKRLAAVASEMCHTLVAARTKHKHFASGHEGYAVMLEELDELWDEIRFWQPTPDQENILRMRKEALQLGAMAIAFVMEVCDK